MKDVDGNEYIDFNSGIALMNIGHSHTKVIEARDKSSCNLYRLKRFDPKRIGDA